MYGTNEPNIVGNELKYIKKVLKEMKSQLENIINYLKKN